ncbi:MAG: hypothetical protein HY903_24400 [Deltaproteobacteria bacterium]|nr:hypothetical protein [Deltaproteobacteria bacterium]
MAKGRPLYPLVLAALTACQGSPSGCAGCAGAPSTPYPAPPPAGGEVVPGGVSLRLTETLLRFLEGQLPALAANVLQVAGDRGVYPLDETLLDPATAPVYLRDGCIGEPDAPCVARTNPAAELGPTHLSTLGFDLPALATALSIEWLDADGSGRPGVRISASNVDVFVDLAVVTNLPSIGTAACHVRDTPGYAGMRVARLAFDLRLGVDATSGRPRFASSAENVVVDLGDQTDDSALHLTVSPCDGVNDTSCDDPRCHGAYGPYPAGSCVDVCGLLDLFAELGGFISNVLRPVLTAMGPAVATAISDALTQGLAVAPLALETQIDAAQILPSIFPAATPLAVAALVADRLDVRGPAPGRGLEIPLDTGTAALTPAACAAGVAPPDLAAMIGAPPPFTGFVEVLDPASGASHFEAYHLVASLALAPLQQALFASFQGGLLCFDLTADQASALTNGAIELNAGMLMNFDSRLAGIAEPESPLALSFLATRAPTVRLGAGGMVGDGVQDPLVEIVVDDLQVDIFVFQDDELVRLAGIVADVVVRLSVDRGAASLDLLVDGISLVDSRQLYNELAPGADLSRLMEMVVDLAVSQLLAGGQRIPLAASSLLGAPFGTPLYLHVSAVRRDLGDTGVPFLSFYATVCDEPATLNPDDPTCFVLKRAPAPIVLVATPTPGPLYAGGAVVVDVEATPRAASPYAYQVSVDGGPWSSFRLAAAGRLEVKSPRLNVAGRHLLALKARRVGDPSRESATRIVTVDLTPPPAPPEPVPVPADAAGPLEVSSSCRAAALPWWAGLAACASAWRRRRP